MKFQVIRTQNSRGAHSPFRVVEQSTSNEVGWITVAAIGNGAAFKKGRGFAAWLGAVPGEHSTGGKQNLTETSRRGNKYLRKLFVQGAHAVLRNRTKQAPGLSTWLDRLTSRKRIQVTAVALANKMARIVWAVLYKGEEYRPPLSAQTVAA
jgi:transposase